MWSVSFDVASNECYTLCNAAFDKCGNIHTISDGVQSSPLLHHQHFLDSITSAHVVLKLLPPLVMPLHSSVI